MNINKLIIDTLKPLNIPVCFQKYACSNSVYITFFEYLNNNEAYADNVGKLIGHYMQIDIWSKGDYTDIVNNVKVALKNAGFSKIYETEMYESDVLVFHKVLRIFISEEVI